MVEADADDFDDVDADPLCRMLFISGHLSTGHVWCSGFGCLMRVLVTVGDSRIMERSLHA